MTTINATFANLAASILAAGKTPWAVTNNNEVTGIFAGRNEARNGKAALGAGTVGKFADLFIEVVADPVVEAPVAKKACAAAPATPVTHASTIERPTKAVWHIADEMVGASRSAVIAECVARGIAFYTARTQYQQWFKVQKEMADREAAQAKAAK